MRDAGAEGGRVECCPAGHRENEQTNGHPSHAGMPSARHRGQLRHVPAHDGWVGDGQAGSALGADGIQHGSDEQGQERCEGAEDRDRDQHPHEAGDGQDADHEPHVDQHGTQGVATLQPRLGSAQDRGATAKDDGNQVGKGAEQHLRDKSGGQRSDEQTQAFVDQRPRRAGGQHPDQTDEGAEQPDDTRHDRPRRIGRRRLVAGHLRQRPDCPDDPAEICRGADSGQRLQPHEGTPDDEHDGAGQDRKCLSRNAFGAIGDPGAQHRGPESDQCAQDGEPDPAQEVEGDVGDHQLPVPGPDRVPGQGRSQSCADGQGQRGEDVVAHRCPESRGQRLAGLEGQRDAMQGGRGAHDHGPDQRQDPEGTDHAGDCGEDAKVQGDQAAGLPTP